MTITKTKLARRLGIALLCSLGCSMPGGVLAQAPAPQEEEGARRAALVAEQFLAREFGAIQELMNEDMKEAFQAEIMGQVLDRLVEQHGAVQEIEDAWLEDVVEGYDRFRVPVTFEREILDFRIVLDSDGLVAGFFYIDHLDPASAGVIEPGPRPDLEGHWEGSIEIPTMTLEIIVDLSYENDAWSGSIDIPMQSAMGLQLEIKRLVGEEIDFAIAGIPGEPTFEGRVADGELSGNFVQSGMDFPFELGRELVGIPARPQEPEPPFPYSEEELVYQNDEITLAGTLTVPEGDGPFPAAILITGTGPQDRNETVFNHRPFLILADHLARNGIAVLRADDRGVGGSTGDLLETNMEDFAADVLAGLDLLKDRPEIDGGRIGLIGHSEGGIVAPLAASMNEDVAFVVMLAGTGLPGADVLKQQMVNIMRSVGVEGEALELVLAEHAKLTELIFAEAESSVIQRQYRRLSAVQQAAVSGGLLPEEESVEESDPETEAFASPWYRSLMKHDPREALRRVSVPVLAMNGERDIQVDPEQNLPEIEKALEEAGNEDVTIQLMEGLNHLFQQAETGAIDEYYRIEETFNPRALDTLSEWILARFGD